MESPGAYLLLYEEQEVDFYLLWIVNNSPRGYYLLWAQHSRPNATCSLGQG